MKLKKTIVPGIITLILTYLLINFPLVTTNLSKLSPTSLYVSTLITVGFVVICVYALLQAMFSGIDIHTWLFYVVETIISSIIWVLLAECFIHHMATSLWASVYALPSLMLFASIKKE